jgi:hypothetical protein
VKQSLIEHRARYRSECDGPPEFAAAGLHIETVASRELERDGVGVTYSTFRMAPMPLSA